MAVQYKHLHIIDKLKYQNLAEHILSDSLIFVWPRMAENM